MVVNVILILSNVNQFDKWGKHENGHNEIEICHIFTNGVKYFNLLSYIYIYIYLEGHKAIEISNDEFVCN